MELSAGALRLAMMAVMIFSPRSGGTPIHRTLRVLEGAMDDLIRATIADDADAFESAAAKVDRIFEMNVS